MLLSTIWTMFTLNKNNGVISIRSNTWHSCGVYLTIYLIIFVCFITTGTINANPSPINITTVPETIVEVDIDLNNGVDDNEQLTTTSIPIFETTTSNNEFISSVIDQLNETINGTNSSTLVDDVVVGNQNEQKKIMSTKNSKKIPNNIKMSQFYRYRFLCD